MPHHQSAGSANSASQSEISQLIDQLSAVKLLKPDFNVKDIRQLGSEIIRKTQGAIASETMLIWPKPSFPDGRSSIMDQFGLNNKNHFFYARPIEWASFLETQITKGFEYFLNEDNKEGHRRRISAFLQTFGITDFDEKQNCQIEAEANAGEKRRIDLQILWESTEHQKNGLVIEAKFGHKIPDDQLKKYEEHMLSKLRIPQQNLHLFVLSPGSIEQHSYAVAAMDNWKEINWFRFLISYEDFLPQSADSEEFRRFRRTVWHRSSN